MIRHCVGGLGGLVLLVGVLVPAVSAQLPLPPGRSCQEDRDHLRVLIKMVADGRGSAEWGLAEALAKQGRLEEDVKTLRELVQKLQPKPDPKPEGKQ